MDRRCWKGDKAETSFPEEPPVVLPEGFIRNFHQTYCQPGFRFLRNTPGVPIDSKATITFSEDDVQETAISTSFSYTNVQGAGEALEICLNQLLRTKTLVTLLRWSFVQSFFQYSLEGVNHSRSR